MQSFENISPQGGKTGETPGDRPDMNRRRFLEKAGMAAAGAALGAVSMEAAAQETREKRITLRGFNLTEFQQQVLQRGVETKAPGAKAEFSLSGPHEVAGEQIIAIDVTIMHKDGRVVHGSATGFHKLTPLDRLAIEALEDAYKK